MDLSNGYAVTFEADRKPTEEEVKSAVKSYAWEQYNLGWRHHDGDGVPVNLEKAADCFRNAAGAGLAEAQDTLGVCYANGQGVPQDFVKAVKWFRRAAEQGDAGGQYHLAECYGQGQGVPQDYAEAVAWYRKAAEQGLADAEAVLGVMYTKGEGVTQDSSEAAKWYRKAANQGNAGAQVNLGASYERGHGVSQDYAEAVKWYRKAAKQSFAPAQYALSLCYYHGHGVAQDYTEAVKWTRAAADQGEPEAQYFFGILCYNGEGVSQNDIEAYKWFCLAAAQGNKVAAELRDSVSGRMSRAEVVEGQSRAAAFVAKKEGAGGGSDGVLPSPETGEGKVFGSGFFVSDDGFLVTCEHVVRGVSSFHVETSGGSLTARLIKKDRAIDVALLKVTGAFRALPVAPEPRVKLGDTVFTIGFPNPDLQGLEPKLTRGEISSMAGAGDNPRYYQISVPVQPGNSGGALVDEYGNAVGVVTARLSDLATYKASGALPQNVNYAIKGNLVRDFLDSVPELRDKLKALNTVRDQEKASAAAERAAVMVIAE